MAGQHLRLSQREKTERLAVYSFQRSRLFQRLREQRHGVSDAPAQRIRRAQVRSRPGEQASEVQILTEVHTPCEEGECLGQVALAES